MMLLANKSAWPLLAGTPPRRWLAYLVFMQAFQTCLQYRLRHPRAGKTEELSSRSTGFPPDRKSELVFRSERNKWEEKLADGVAPLNSVDVSKQASGPSMKFLKVPAEIVSETSCGIAKQLPTGLPGGLVSAQSVKARGPTVEELILVRDRQRKGKEQFFRWMIAVRTRFSHSPPELRNYKCFRRVTRSLFYEERG